MATAMKRSPAQVLRGFLPGQTFEHPNETIVRVLWTPVGGAEVNRDLLMEALQLQLERWSVPDSNGGPPVNRAPGFLMPVSDHADKYAAVEPQGTMFYKTWPLVMRCTNKRCARVEFLNDEAAWKKAALRSNPARCDLCSWPRRQFEYLLVHNCGRDRALQVPACSVKDGNGREHGYRHVYLYDTRSFLTAAWHCRHGSCGSTERGRRIEGMRQPGCGCGVEPGANTYRNVTLRQDLRFITHTLKFVSFDLQPMVALRSAPGAEKVVVGSYLEYFSTDWERALNEVSKDRSDAEAKWLKVRKLMELDGATPEELADMRKTIVGESGGAFDDIVDAVGEDIVARVGADQRSRERTLIWGEGGLQSDLSVWRMKKFRAAAALAGRQGAVQVIDEATNKLTLYGFSDLLVVDNFPVALAAYGTSRVARRPEQALLQPFPTLKSGGAKHKGKAPIYCSATNTEAVFFELDAERVISWLDVNGRMNAPVPTLPDASLDDGKIRRQAAKAFMLGACHRDQDVKDMCFLLQHTLAHALIKNLGERSGFGEDTMSEYLMPETLTIGLFADVQQELSLGALVALVEHRLGEWLEATALDAQDCQWDPHCSEDVGACMACLHLAFGCDELNGKLDRGVLFGTPDGHEPDISVGYWDQVPALP